MIALHAKSPRVIAKVVDHLRKLTFVKENGINIAIGPLGCLALPHICGSFPPRHRAAGLETANDVAEVLSPVARHFLAIGMNKRQSLLDKENAVKMLGHQLRLDQRHLRPEIGDLAPAI